MPGYLIQSFQQPTITASISMLTFAALNATGLWLMKKLQLGNLWEVPLGCPRLNPFQLVITCVFLFVTCVCYVTSILLGTISLLDYTHTLTHTYIYIYLQAENTLLTPKTCGLHLELMP